MGFRKILESLLKEDDKTCTNCGSTDTMPSTSSPKHYIPLFIEKIGIAYAGIRSLKYYCYSCNQEF